MHVNEVGDLVNDHFGGPATETVVIPDPQINGWVYGMGRIQREYPDLGRGDFRLPAVHIHHAQGYTVSQFIYDSHDVVQGKPPLPGLPATFGMDDQVSTLIVHLYDNHSAVALDLSYSIFPEYDAIVRSAAITNKGDLNITVEKAASFSVDLPYQELDMINVHGDWAREQTRQRSRVDYGVQRWVIMHWFGSVSGILSDTVVALVPLPFFRHICTTHSSRSSIPNPPRTKAMHGASTSSTLAPFLSMSKKALKGSLER